MWSLAVQSTDRLGAEKDPARSRHLTARPSPPMRAGDVTARSHEVQLRSAPEARAPLPRAQRRSLGGERRTARALRPTHKTGGPAKPSTHHQTSCSRVKRRQERERTAKRRSAPECLKSETGAVLLLARHAHGGSSASAGDEARGDRRGGCSFPHTTARLSRTYGTLRGRQRRAPAYGRHHCRPGCEEPAAAAGVGGDPSSTTKTRSSSSS